MTKLAGTVVSSPRKVGLCTNDRRSHDNVVNIGTIFVFVLTCNRDITDSSNGVFVSTVVSDLVI